MNNQPLDLAALVARLRDAGLRTDIRQYLAAHELLLALAGRGHNLLDDSEALASHLGPIFCGSPEEQQLFRDEFMAWRGAPRAVAAAATPPAKKKDERRAWLAICATVTLAGTAGLLWWKLHPEPVPPSPPPPGPVEPAPKAADPPAIRSSFVVSAPTLVGSDDVQVQSIQEVAVPWPTIVAGGLGAALLAFLLMWLRHKARRDRVLSRMTPDPNTKRIELNPPPPTITQIRTIALRRISAGLRRTRANEVFDLSVTATVNATANAGGFIVPVFAPRVAIPEYLVLIDRRSESDHSAQLVHGWVEQLCDQGVAADCYEFDSDPRVCREFGSQRSHRLPALLARHHRATVLLFAESGVCIDPVTNRPQEWLRWFNSLPNRVLLTMAPPYRWAANEQRMTEAGFVVVPASPGGLQIAAAMDRNALETLGAGARYAREFPRMIARDTLRWLDRNPPPEATVTRLLRALHEFLGPDGYSWMCACAIYPQISWPITLTLLETLLPAGSDLPARRAIDEQLPSIARLPWFRYGYMPDWLRKLLIVQLDAEKEATVRAKLAQLVCGLLANQGTNDAARREEDGSNLAIRIRSKALDVARAAPPSSPLQDEVFLGFLAGAAPDPLSLRLSSLPHIGRPRARSLGVRLREWWRGLNLRHPLLVRVVISLLVGVAAAAIARLLLQEAPAPRAVPDSDITYYLASSDLSSSQTKVAVAPNGQFMLLASPQAGPFVEIRDLVRNEMRGRISLDRQPYLLAISPRSDRIAILDDDGALFYTRTAGVFETGNLVRVYPLGDGLPQNSGIAVTFSNDSARLLVYHSVQTFVYDVQSDAEPWRANQGAAAAAFHPDDPDQVLVFDGDRLRSFVTVEGKSAATVDRPLAAPSVHFSLDGRNLARAAIEPTTRAWLVELQDSITGTSRATMTLPPDATPAGWAWSGDGNLVAYEQGAGANGIYNISFKQPLITQQSKISASNRLYTIRFSRSDRRRPDYTYYELTERTIDVVPETATPPANPPPQNPSIPPRNETQAAPPSAEIAKANEAVLARLDRETAAQARMLIDLARKENIIARLRAPIRNIRHRSDISQKLDAAGRAFDVEVLMPNNTWSTTDYSALTAIAQIAYKLGFEWSGDWGYKQFSHFELPPDVLASPAQASNNDSPAGDPPPAEQAVRLERTEFEYPEAGKDEIGSSYTETIWTTGPGGRKAVGRFRLGLDMIVKNNVTSIDEVVLVANAIDERSYRYTASRDVGAQGSLSAASSQETIVLRASDFAASKAATRVADVGMLQFTLTILNAELLPSWEGSGFSRRNLRLRVTVQAPADVLEQRRAPARAD